MAVYHTPAWALKGGTRTGIFNVVPRRDRISSGGEMVKTTGFSITIPRNGVLDLDALDSVTQAKGELALGEKWKEETEKFIDRNLGILGLVKGHPVPDEPTAAVRTEAVQEATARTVARIQRGRSLSNQE